MPPIVAVGEVLWDIDADGVERLGGAPFNFVHHCRALGREAILVSRVGRDERGERIRAAMNRFDLSDEFLQTDEEKPTGTVLVRKQPNGVNEYDIVADVAWDHLQWNDELDQLAHRAAAVYTGILAQRNMAARMPIASWMFARCCGPHVVDVNFRPPFHRNNLRFTLSMATMVKFAEDELATACETLGYDAPTLADQVAHLTPHDQGNGQLWITRGERGAELWREGDDSPVVVPGVPALVVDTVGAGDAFCAAMLVKQLGGVPAAEALRFAVEYSAKVCEHAGAISTES